MKSYQVNEKGYYGEFGGAYIPEILHRCVSELQEAYSRVLDDEGFKKATKGSRKSTRSCLKTTWDALPHSISPIACPRNTAARSISRGKTLTTREHTR